MPEKTSVFLYFGTHGENNWTPLQSLRNDMRDRLRAKPGRLVVVMEAVDVTDVQSRFISKAVTDGMFPSAAVDESFKLPELSSLGNSSPDLHGMVSEELQICDYIATDFPGRIDVRTEGAALEEIQERSFMSAIRDQNLEFAMNLVSGGSFADGLSFFQSAVNLYRENITPRDEQFVSLYQQASQEDNVVGVFGFAGVAHSGISKDLQALEVSVISHFAQKGADGIFWFPPIIIASRMMKTLERDLTELEWYKAMIGTTVYTMFVQQMEEHGIPSPEQNAVRRTLTFLKDFQNMKDIWEFEKGLKR